MGNTCEGSGGRGKTWVIGQDGRRKKRLRKGSTRWNWWRRLSPRSICVNSVCYILCYAYFVRGGLERAWRLKRGIFLDISLAWEVGRLCGPLSLGYIPPPSGRGRTGAPHNLRLIRRIDSKKKKHAPLPFVDSRPTVFEGDIPP